MGGEAEGGVGGCVNGGKEGRKGGKGREKGMVGGGEGEREKREGGEIGCCSCAESRTYVVKDE